MEHWINFYINACGHSSMLDEDPHVTQRYALDQIADHDGCADSSGIVWTYTHSITVDFSTGVSDITNLTPLVKEMHDEDKLDRAHNRAVTAGLRAG